MIIIVDYRAQPHQFDVGRVITVRDLRGLIERRLDVDPLRQRLFFSGKEMQDRDEADKECTLWDYGVGQNGMTRILLIPRAAPAPETAADPVAASSATAAVAATPAPQPADSAPVAAPAAATTAAPPAAPAAADEADEPTPDDIAITKATDAALEDEVLVCRCTAAEDGKPHCENVPWVTNFRWTRCWCVPESSAGKARKIKFVLDAVPLLKDLTSYCLIKSRPTTVPTECRWQVVDGEIEVVKKKKKEVTVSVPDGKKLDGGYYTLAEINKEAASEPCAICSSTDDPETQVLCEQCNRPFHMKCLGWTENKEGDFFCAQCEASHKADNKPVMTKRMANAPSAKQTKKWGGGKSCAGRSTTCTIVPTHHFGPIPGIAVGTVFTSRLHLSEGGVHRPPVSGISGTEKVGSQSIVLSGGYEDDHDDGDEFTYTGAGGRDLSGNKRTNVQSCDQKLESSNKALAINFWGHVKGCKDCKIGGPLCDPCKADFKKGKPVRVCRSQKFGKATKKNAHASDYAPRGWGTTSVRYDGIYKLKEYWSERGSSTFLVWRYRFVRDDEEPAPWTPEGKKNEQLYRSAADLLDPTGKLKEEHESKSGSSKEGDSEEEQKGSDDEIVLADEEVEEEKPKKKAKKTSAKKTQAGKRSRKAEEVQETEKAKEEKEEQDPSPKKAAPSPTTTPVASASPATTAPAAESASPPKRKAEAEEKESPSKAASGESPKKLKTLDSFFKKKDEPKEESKDLKEMRELVASDAENKAKWDELLVLIAKTNKGIFLQKVLEDFKCPVCSDLCVSPLTAPCKHSQCQECFRKARRSGITNCPQCRYAFSDVAMDAFHVNQDLKSILKTLFPHLAARKAK